MVAILTGQETIPGQPDHPVNLTAEQVGMLTQQGFGLSPAESDARYQQLVEQRRVEAERKRLAQVQAQAKQAQSEYYTQHGQGYGTYPGGPDYTYMPGDAPFGAGFIYDTLDPYYGEGGIFSPVTDLVTGEGGARGNLVLYGALAIGALALLKR